MNEAQDSRLSAQTFHDMEDFLLSEDFDKVEITDFFGTLAAMDEPDSEVIELKAHVEAGKLVLEQPAPLPVAGNVIQIDNKRIVISLQHTKDAA